MNLIEDAASIAAPELAVPLRVVGWVRSHPLVIVGGIASAACLALAANIALHHKAEAVSQAVQAKVNQASATAVQQSASDAVNTVTHEVTREHDIERTVINAQAAVQSADNGAAADAAGRDGLCAIAPSDCPAAPVQHVDTGRVAPARS